MTTLSLSKDKIRFLLLEGIHEAAVDALAEQGYHNVERLTHTLDGADLNQALANVHFLGIRSRTQVGPEALAAAGKAQRDRLFLHRHQPGGSGQRNRGVPVFNAPFSNTRSVAELVLAEIVFLMRGIPTKNAQAHRGTWLKSANQSYEVRGKTLGIVGYGHIGTQLGVLAESLGMRVVFFDIENKLPLGNATASRR